MFIFSLQYEYNIHHASEGIILKQDQTTRKCRETGREILFTQMEIQMIPWEFSVTAAHRNTLKIHHLW